MEWDAKLLTGVKEIDTQHRYFYDLMHRLTSEMVNSTDSRYNQLLLLELAKYAEFHFFSEENIMLNASYPELTTHRNKHRELLDALNSKSSFFEGRKVLGAGIIQFLKEWFINHTVTDDKRFGEFLGGK